MPDDLTPYIYPLASATFTIEEDEATGGTIKTLYVVGKRAEQPDEVYVNGTLFVPAKPPSTLVDDGEPVPFSEAIAMMGISNTTAYKLINEGQLDTITRGKNRLVKRSSIERIKRYGYEKRPTPRK